MTDCFFITLLTVPPEEVKILGDNTVRADRSVSYRCLANNANPAPAVEWTVNGQVMTAGVNTFTHPPPANSVRRRTNSGDEEQMSGDLAFLQHWKS